MSRRQRMEIEVETRLLTVKQYDNGVHRLTGRVETLIQATKKYGKKWLAGKRKQKQPSLSQIHQLIKL